MRGLEVFGLTKEVGTYLFPYGFRPLAGIRGLRTGENARAMEWLGVCFRPLAGIRGLRTLMVKKEYIGCLKVSVPLRGLEVFGPIASSHHVDRVVEFPSPCGD